MSLIEREKYIAGRRSSTLREIEATNTRGEARRRLLGLLWSRRSLAQIYYEDGARDTARIIEEVDIALIQAAIDALPTP